MLKLASKFAMDIFPSVIATIIGAYIVNHYINAKTPADTAAPAAAVSTVDPKKASAKADSKPAEKSGDLANIPEPGVRAKGISEKSITDRSPTERAAEKPSEKADRPSETASIPPVAPAETGNRHKVTREKAASKPNPAPAPEPVAAAPATAPSAEPAANGPDANDLARAAIERLRGSEPAPAAPRARKRAARWFARRRLNRPVSWPRRRPHPHPRSPWRPRPPQTPPLSSRCRRRFWCRRHLPNNSGRRLPPRGGPTIRSTPPRRPIFLIRAQEHRSTCAPTQPRRQSGHRSPKMCCRPRSRCSIRCCRSREPLRRLRPSSHIISECFVALTRFAADACERGSRGLVFRTQIDGAAV